MLTHTLAHSLTHTYILAHALPHPLTPSPTHSLTYSTTTLSTTHSTSHSTSHSLTQTVTQPLTHPHTHPPSRYQLTYVIGNVHFTKLWEFYGLSVWRYLSEHFSIFYFGIMIYTCLLQQDGYFEIGFWFWFEPLWSHNHLVSTVGKASVSKQCGIDKCDFIKFLHWY